MAALALALPARAEVTPVCRLAGEGEVALMKKAGGTRAVDRLPAGTVVQDWDSATVKGAAWLQVAPDPSPFIQTYDVDFGWIAAADLDCTGKPARLPQWDGEDEDGNLTCTVKGAPGDRVTTLPWFTPQNMRDLGTPAQEGAFAVVIPDWPARVRATRQITIAGEVWLRLQYDTEVAPHGWVPAEAVVCD